MSLLWRDKPDLEMNANRLKSNRDTISTLVREDNDNVDNVDIQDQSTVISTSTSDITSSINPTANDGLVDSFGEEIPDDMIAEDGEVLYTVESIVDRKKCGKGYKYLVKRLNYPHSENTRQNASEPMGDAVKNMISAYNAKLNSTKKLRGGSSSTTKKRSSLRGNRSVQNDKDREARFLLYYLQINRITIR